jgi:hypothetical protein
MRLSGAAKVLTSPDGDWSIAGMKLGLAIAALAAVMLPAAGARAERPRIAVMEMSAPKIASDLRQRVTRAVQEGLLASGADVVEGMPAAATGPGGAPCDGSGCVTAVAKASVASYVVRGTFEVVGRTYGLRLEILDGRSGDLMESREDRCEICTEGEALEMAGVSASALKVEAFRKKVVALPAPGTPPEPAAAIAAPAVVTELEPPPPEAARDHRRLGWIGLGAGAAAVVVGAIFLAIDGEGTCDDQFNQCERVYDMKGPGLASFAVGGLALAAGALVLAGKF